ncbi:hypothetical protein MUP77_12675 [Candidatus Bathyarchaeota archaeon]|nr:hypothetical protein [Candidatus Bathyarchaeota archaeon]
MVRVVLSAGNKGSKKWVQKLVNEKPELLNHQILERLTKHQNESIRWLSPLKSDKYAEYSDQESLDLLGINLKKRSLDSFWPVAGPRWDGLGKSDSGIFLVEAKSHVSELFSCVGAKGKSLSLILRSLGETKNYLSPNSPVDWSQGFYQYANRLAHLYLLRELNDQPAYLAFVYFLDDSEMTGPSSISEWKGAIELLHTYLGIRRHKLQKYIIDIFIDVNQV